MVTVASEQLALFEFPAIPQFTVHLPPLRDPIWTENKAKLIERYLYYFVLVTRHGIYVDGFAGPQKPSKPETWAARLVLESEPKWLRKFFLYDAKPKKVRLLEKLKEDQPPACNNEPTRTVEVIRADFNTGVHKLLASGKIGEREATFCLLDQQTFECHWSTLQALARHKQGEFKIELFYFLPSAWLDRAMAAQRDHTVLNAWWGSSDWQRVRNMREWDRALLFCERLKQELGYKSVLPWSIYQRRHGGRVMYRMIHATDHPHAPNLMFRAYRQAVTPKERPERLQLEFEAWKAART